MFGIKIIYTEHALRDSEERNFPESRHRSARIKKKLIKRYGSEFVRVPCAFRTGDRLIVHPSMRSRIEAEFNSVGTADRESFGARNPITGGYNA